MKVYDWPRSGTPTTDVAVRIGSLSVEDAKACVLARRVRRYAGFAVVFRDPELSPHVPKREKSVNLDQPAHDGDINLAGEVP